MITLKNYLPKSYSALLILFALGTMGCYTRPKKSGILDFMNISNFVSYLTGSSFPLNVQVNGLTNSGVLVVELASTAEQLTFSAAGTNSFSGYYDSNIVYTLNIVSQPATTPTQTCVISNPNLTLTFASTTFVVNCAENWYKANVAVTGIDSTNTTNLQIYNNGTDLKTTSTNGTVSFDVGDGLAYDITIGSVPTVPSTHTCQVVTSPANGTIAGADVNLQISCLSLMKTSVIAGGFMPSTKAMTFTFSGPVTGCVLDSTGGGPPYSAGTASGSPGVTYIGNGARIAPTTLPWSFGALTFPLQVNFTLTGCADAVAAANNGAALSVTVKMMEGDVYFISDTSGNDSNSCMDPSDSCKTIQTGVNLCSSSSICTVFVEGGNYIISGSVSPISLTSTGGVRLLGSFDPTFSTQSLDLTPSRIADNRTVAQCPGTALSSNECAPITITASGMAGDSTKAHVVQGFSIFADETKPNAFGIRFLNGDANSYAYVFGNYISGGEGGLGVENSTGTRGGIDLTSSASNNQIDTNVIKGGFGALNSTAVYSFNSNAYLLRNRISGDKAANDSHSVWVVNFADSLIAIINNTMNFRQYTDASVTSKFTYGIRTEENAAALIKHYIAGNTIYSNGATVGSNYGIYMTGAATNAQMDNNLIMAQGSNGVCANFTNTPTTNATFRGNNLTCSAGTMVNSVSTNYNLLCTGVFTNAGLCVLAILSQKFMNDGLTTNRSDQNFTDTPSFSGYPALQPWLSMGLAAGGPCNIAFGGVETSAYLNSFDSAYKLDAVIGSPVTRTTSSGGSTPSGSAGYSIGAFELDSGCL
ncbi:hypothetical protein CH371_16500 [Leptospira wolffii]|uniref:Uncharacterized protein n=1 Tax=Leptospira wolffii TaxID=409998 RepID=A0A2M9Z8H7_9LEPT|nr:hypothetical protein [Leptospira wolffii]PJZ64723.1 hypothetical protein CH371_16500 [Leptospira wolffii]